MIKTNIPIVNFVYGQVDRAVKSRFDLPVYQNGAEVMKNFFCTMHGNAVYRNGFEMIAKTGKAKLIEFKFNVGQSYLLVITFDKIKFFGYDETKNLIQVLDDRGNPLEVSHEWGDERFRLKFDQCGDVMYFTNGNKKKKRLKRSASNVFTLEDYTIVGDTIGGNPQVVKFYENRLNYIGNYTKIYGSKGGIYDDLTIGANKNDGYKFDLAEIKTCVSWLYNGQSSLIAGSPDGIMTLNGGGNDKAITPTDIKAKLSSSEGASEFDPIEKDGYVLFSSLNRRNLYGFSYDVLSESFKATHVNKANYEITKGGLGRLVYKRDQYNLIWGICGDNLIGITLQGDENVNGWHVHDTQGKFYDICTMTRPDGTDDMFVMTERFGEDYLERSTDYVEYSRREDFNTGNKEEDKTAYYRKISEEFKNINFLDCSVKYDGFHSSTLTIENDVITSGGEDFSLDSVNRRINYKTKTGYEYGQFVIKEFINANQVKVKTLLSPTHTTYTGWYLSASRFTGLEHLEGKNVSVVADGGYVGDFVVKNGIVDISNAGKSKADICIIGLRYDGIIKSFNLGFNIQGVSTQTLPKNIYKAVIRFVFSAGGLFGDNLYDLVPIQKFNPDGLYDNIPLPMDGDEEISYSGDYSEDKRFYIVQREPLPLQVAMVVPYFAQSTTN